MGEIGRKKGATPPTRHFNKRDKPTTALGRIRSPSPPAKGCIERHERDRTTHDKTNWSAHRFGHDRCANFALTNRPCSHHFPHFKNFLGPKRCTTTFFNVLTLHWQNLSRIHRADLELWTETCHHVGLFRFGPKFGSTPRLGTRLLGRILARN